MLLFVIRSLLLLGYVSLQILCIGSCIVVYRLTWQHDALRKANAVPKEWRAFIRPPGESLPPMWLALLRAGTIAPIKLVVMTSLVVFTTTFACVVSPKTGLWIASYMGPLAAWISGVSHVKFFGKPVLATEAPLVVPNHVSWIDFLILGGSGWFGFVMSEAASTAPIVGRGFTKMALHVDSVVLDRSSAASREAAKIKISQKLAKMRTQPKERLLIFPEGTLTNQEYVVPFKLGAFDTMQPVQPIRLEFSNPHFSHTDLSTVTSVAFNMCLGSTDLIITWCNVVKPKDGESAASFANRAREEMVRDSSIKLAYEGGYRDHLELFASS